MIRKEKREEQRMEEINLIKESHFEKNTYMYKQIRKKTQIETRMMLPLLMGTAKKTCPVMRAATLAIVERPSPPRPPKTAWPYGVVITR